MFMWILSLIADRIMAGWFNNLNRKDNSLH